MSVSDKEWIQRFRAERSDMDFKRTILFHLDNIRSAPPEERPGLAASFGGFLRSCRGSCRIQLAHALIEELNITPTFHVAKYVMLEAYGEAIANISLKNYFAESGRDATEKFMSDARRKLNAHPLLIERHFRLYRFYCKALKRTVKRLK